MRNFSKSKLRAKHGVIQNNLIIVKTIFKIESGSEFIHNNLYKFSSYAKGSVLRISYIKFYLMLKMHCGGRNLPNLHFTGEETEILATVKPIVQSHTTTQELAKMQMQNQLSPAHVLNLKCILPRRKEKHTINRDRGKGKMKERRTREKGKQGKRI